MSWRKVRRVSMKASMRSAFNARQPLRATHSCRTRLAVAAWFPAVYSPRRPQPRRHRRPGRVAGNPRQAARPGRPLPCPASTLLDEAAALLSQTSWATFQAQNTDGQRRGRPGRRSAQASRGWPARGAAHLKPARHPSCGPGHGRSRRPHRPPQRQAGLAAPAANTQERLIGAATSLTEAAAARSKSAHNVHP